MTDPFTLRKLVLIIVALLAVKFDRTSAQTESPAPASSQPSQITAENGYDCCSDIDFETPEPNHIVVTLNDRGHLDWWMFRLVGVAGKTVQIDIKSNTKLSKWTTLNPMYAEAMGLNDPALYVAGPSTGQILSVHNVTLPTTDGQKWHYITNTNLRGNNLFTMTQKFASDAVWIANRVPYTPGYNEEFIRGLASNPVAKIIEIGRTAHDRPLLLVQIGGDDAAEKAKPCVVIAGGEQADQPDGMWSANGAIEYLLGDGDEPKKLRNECRYLIIPMLDPDGTANSRETLPGEFNPESNSLEAADYADFFQNWVNDGNRLDAVFEIHSMQSHEAPHLSRAFIDERPQAAAIDRAVVRKFTAAGLQFSSRVQTRTPVPSRFSGWLSSNYGPLNILYEMNAQAPTRHLDLMQLKATGALFVEGAGEFLTGPDGAAAMAAVDAVRAKRQAYWVGSPSTNPSQGALESEAAARDAAQPAATPQGAAP